MSSAGKDDDDSVTKPAGPVKEPSAETKSGKTGMYYTLTNNFLSIFEAQYRQICTFSTRVFADQDGDSDGDDAVVSVAKSKSDSKAGM